MDAPAIDITPKQDGGVMKRILVPGTGHEHPGHGDIVKVHYTGKLTNGDVFDSSIPRKEQFSFSVGKGEVIRGWDITLGTMKKGEKCEVTLKPEYAYGAQGSPPKIAPNSTLIFEIELFDWDLQDVSPDKSRSVLMKFLRAAEGYDRPRLGTVVVNVSAYLNNMNNEPYDSRTNVMFRLGEAAEFHIPKGIDLALRQMKKGELARVYIRCPTQSYDEKIPIPEDLKFEYPKDWEEIVVDLELVDFENEKEVWEMTSQERIDQAESTKERGTGYFKEGKFELALRQYDHILQYIGPPDNHDYGMLSETRTKSMLSAYLNLALCNLKLNRTEEVIVNANLALKIDPKNEKALFRRGMAYISQHEYDRALEDFRSCLEIDPNNKAASNQLVICKHQIRQHTEREKKMYKNILNVIGK